MIAAPKYRYIELIANYDYDPDSEFECSNLNEEEFTALTQKFEYNDEIKTFKGKAIDAINILADFGYRVISSKDYLGNELRTIYLLERPI